MITAVSTNDVDRSAASAAQTQSAPKAPAQSQPSNASLPHDTVSISKAAHSAQQEATETQAQTAREATQGDHQAQKLAAKEAAASKAH
jgi:hypothetical protein